MVVVSSAFPTGREYTHSCHTASLTTCRSGIHTVYRLVGRACGCGIIGIHTQQPHLYTQPLSLSSHSSHTSTPPPPPPTTHPRPMNSSSTNLGSIITNGFLRNASCIYGVFNLYMCICTQNWSRVYTLMTTLSV